MKLRNHIQKHRFTFPLNVFPKNGFTCDIMSNRKPNLFRFPGKSSCPSSFYISPLAQPTIPEQQKDQEGQTDLRKNIRYFINTKQD